VTENLLSCRMWSYGKYMDAAWTHLPSLGVRHIETQTPETADAAEQLASQLRASGLKVATFQGRFDILAADAASQLTPQINLCERFGVNRLFLSVKRKQMPAKEAYSRLRDAGEIAARAGVTLLLETHPDLVTNGNVGEATMQGVNHPNVRINFDTANVYYYNEGVTAPGELQKLLPWVEGVHFKDTMGNLQEHNFPPLGQGVVDYPAVVRILNARGFHGPFTMELEGKAGVELDRQQTLQQVEDSVRYLRSTGLF
jgi:sugar phosphate isomerase/epimerase